MKIAFLNKYQNKVFRGAETFVYELSKRLIENHKVDVISDINYLDLFKKRYDIIIPTNGRLQAIVIRIITWLRGGKMIVSGQSGMGWDDRLNLYACPDRFIALSSRALSWARKVNPFVKSVRIPNGVDIEKFKPKETNDNKTKTVLCVGAFTKQKRLNLVIDAVSRLNGVKLILAGGGGELRKEIAELGESKLGKERFEIITVPFDKMPGVYQRADAFTLPSESSESFGNVLVEAMASNIPVVATDDAIRREIVGEGGILVDPTDTVEYSHAITEALYKDWDDRPRKQAEKFSWDKIAEEYENLFKLLK
ncbi:MAG TPA: glycosyltransferase family 4 protein [Patescibacteria group bacterium]|nr:glycosyltransferase family 4 protein [Patescibacteria group bacterium]